MASVSQVIKPVVQRLTIFVVVIQFVIVSWGVVGIFDLLGMVSDGWFYQLHVEGHSVAYGIVFVLSRAAMVWLILYLQKQLDYFMQDKGWYSHTPRKYHDVLVHEPLPLRALVFLFKVGIYAFGGFIVSSVYQYLCGG